MRRLYFKILIHWLLALIVTEGLVFGLFILVTKDAHRAYAVETIGRATLLARDYAEAALTQPAQTSPDKAMHMVVQRLAATSHAKIWLSDMAGAPLAASFSDTAKTPEFPPGTAVPYEDARIQVDIGPRRLAYATIPLVLGTGTNSTATLHLLTERQPGRFPHGRFGAGLALIGLVVAAIAIPLSRHITKPLKRLQVSALQIAGGDLSARNDVQGQDEIGKLGAAFNSMAETVERMVQAGRELTANVSHEMRSPLARIRIGSECLQKALTRGDHAEVTELLEGMWQDIEEADQMIGRILEYSKLDFCEPFTGTAPISPGEILAGLLKSMRPLFKTKGITVTAHLEPNLTTDGDAERLRTALKNIIENAARYTPDNGHVQVQLRPEEDTLLLEVTNSSAPLSPEELTRIFEPFYRGTGAGGVGTGLGLALTRKIMLLHHGSIGARNTPNGFQLWLRLPQYSAVSPPS